jgi:carboxyl-terminal processing protease
MTFRVPGLLLAVLVASVPAPAQGNRTATPPTAPAAAAAAPAVASEAAAVRVRTFEQVWQTVNDKFFDPTFNGVDWNGVRARYAPRVAALTSDDALYPLLNTMLDELKVSHFAVIPPASMEEMSSSLEDDDSFGGDTGMTVRVVEGRPTVTAVDAGGPAAAAGLRPGFTLVRVGSHDLAEVLAKVKESGKRPVEQLYDARRKVESLLNGMPGKPVEVTYLDAADARHTAAVVRRSMRGKPIKFGAMPTVLARVDARRLENNVGYVAFNIFLPQMMDQIRDAIRSFGDAPGVVVDLRNNPGGLGPMGTAVAALFLDKDTPLGTMQMRNGNLNFIAVAQPGPYTRPVAVLVDEGSASTSELLAAGLQECGRAAVVGGASLGAMLPSVIERLPNGAIFQYAVADFKTPKGVFLEGRGVVPDVPVTETRAAYLAGGDPVLEAALSYIRRASSASPAPTPQAPR